MIKIDTFSGSVYEIDSANKKVRRVSGTHEPTSNQGIDGEWKHYELVHHVRNLGLVIEWNEQGSATITSRVTSHTHEELTSLLT